MNNLIKKYRESIQQSKRYTRLEKWWKTLTLPGFEGVPIQYVAKQFAMELRKDRIGPRASAIAYNFILALFPTLIFWFSLIPIIPISGLPETIFELVERILPDKAYHLFHDTIADTISQRRVDLLSFGFLASIIFATNGMNAILKTFAKINPAFKVRSFVREWFVALMLTMMLSVLVLLGLVLIVGGSKIVGLLISYFQINNDFTIWLLSSLRWVMLMIIYFFGLSIIYYFGPAMHNKWKFVSVGSTVATFLSMLASVGFSFYVNNFGQYNKLYGSLGTFIVVMIWVYINALVLIFGFELNNSIRLRKMELDE